MGPWQCRADRERPAQVGRQRPCEYPIRSIGRLEDALDATTSYTTLDIVTDRPTEYRNPVLGAVIQRRPHRRRDIQIPARPRHTVASG